MYKASIDQNEWMVFHPKKYTGNPLYGKKAMELVDAAPTDALSILIKAGEELDEKASVRRSNRTYLIGALACLELYYRDKVDFFDEELQERIIKCSINTFVKDLPMKLRAMRSLYWRSRKAVKFNV